MMGSCPLSHAISMALGQHASWLTVGPRAMAMGLADLDLSLPALPGGSTVATTLSDDQIRAYAALYYYGELETTGLMEVAELLAEERDMMGIRDASLYQALDNLHRAMGQQWYTTERRQMIFGSMLGFGQAGGIQSALVGFTRTISQYEGAFAYGARLDHSHAAQLDMAGHAVLGVIASRAAMGLERAAQLLNGQTRAALEVLQNPALHRRTGARDMWGFLQSVAAPAQGTLPDLGRATRRAQSGAGLIAALTSARSAGGLLATLQTSPDLMRFAADWQMNAPTPTPAPAPPTGMYQPRQSGGWA